MHLQPTLPSTLRPLSTRLDYHTIKNLRPGLVLRSSMVGKTPRLSDKFRLRLNFAISPLSITAKKSILCNEEMPGLSNTIACHPYKNFGLVGH